MVKTLDKAKKAFQSGLLLIFPLFLLSFPDQHAVSLIAGKEEAAGLETTAAITDDPALVQETPAIEAVAETQPATVQEILLDVCESRGYGAECGKTLLGMLWKESTNISTAVGDQGRSHGYFQIQTKLHRVSLECTRDLVCSANWTIGYMERHGYPRHVMHAVQCHNGCLVNNGYAASAMRHGQRLWNTPLPVAKTLATAK